MCECRNLRGRLAATLPAGLIIVCAVVSAYAQTGGEDPKDIIASQIRRQGFTCDKPKSATRDQEQSSPNETVWILQCEQDSYRVRLVPNMGANVERLEKEAQ